MPEKKEHSFLSNLALIWGVIILVLALVLPWFGDAKRNWTEEKAAKLQQAASTLHQFYGHGTELGGRAFDESTAEPTEEDRQYKLAMDEFQLLKLELQEAKSGNWITTKWLIGFGIFLLGFGIVGRNMRHHRLSN